jgi:IMP-specific 5'-nucleotidase
MKSMLQHSFVLDALETTADDTFRHFEILIEEHRMFEQQERSASLHVLSSSASSASPSGTWHKRASTNLARQPHSRLRQLVPTIGSFHTPLPLREAFNIYNEKHRLVRFPDFMLVLPSVFCIVLLCNDTNFSVLPIASNHRPSASTSRFRLTRFDIF